MIKFLVALGRLLTGRDHKDEMERQKRVRDAIDKRIDEIERIATVNGDTEWMRSSGIERSETSAIFKECNKHEHG